MTSFPCVVVGNQLFVPTAQVIQTAVATNANIEMLGPYLAGDTSTEIDPSMLSTSKTFRQITQTPWNVWLGFTLMRSVHNFCELFQTKKES